MIGAGANSLLFFVLLIVQVVLGLAVFSYAAHSFLTILVDTAAGNDQVLWPAEPFTDWLWKPWYLVWVFAVWLTPLALMLTLLRFKPLQVQLVSLMLFWLVAPLGLLSSLSAASRWIVFRPVIVWCMLRQFGTTLVFYVATEFVLAAWGGVMYFTLRDPDRMLLVPVTALVTAAVLFLYGRLVGRLAWVINQRKLGPQEEAAQLAAETQVQDPWSGPSTAPRPEEEPQRGKSLSPKAVDPWAIPSQEEEDDYWKKGLPLEVQRAGRYDILTQEPPRPSPKPVPEKRRSPGVYAAEPVKPEKRAVESLIPEVSKREKELAEPTPEAPPPALPMFSGVYSFLRYPATVGPLLTITLGLWLMGLVLRLQLSFIQF